MENNRNKYRSSLLIVVIMMTIVSCRKPEQFEVKKPTAVRRVQALQLQTRNQQTSARTFPIDMQSATIINPIELAAKSDDSSGVDEALVNRIFQDVLSQGEKLWGRYFLDGQYAYSNNIRRYIEKRYDVVCHKYFIFGDLTAASPRYGCVASWKYDVACAIRGKQGVVYILDPRIFSSVVTQNKWMEFHLYPTASVPQPRLTFQALVAGESFTPIDNVPSGYLVDADYRYTDIMVDYYADSVGCNILQ